MIISVCVVAYNEQKVLPDLLECIKSQDYPHNQMEVVLIDSCSEDNTKKIMEKFREENKDFVNVQVLDNPRKIQAAGWNVAIKNYKGDAILRVMRMQQFPRNLFVKMQRS